MFSGVGSRLERDALVDREAVALEPRALRRVVRQQPHRTHAEVHEDLCADAVLARVRREPELDVGLHRVPALVLQLVGAQLVGQPDRPALVAPDVQDDPAALARRSCAIDRWSWSPQSHRSDPNTSPVRHSECTRVRTSAPSPMSPSTSATWVRPSTELSYAYDRNSPCGGRDRRLGRPRDTSISRCAAVARSGRRSRSS